MLKKALTSVTFRQLSAEDIVALAKEAGLDAIEWGGDIHVPPGGGETARRVRALSENAGLLVSAYGSYYRAGTYGDPASAFEPVLESALALGAPVIRVWAGDRGSGAMSLEDRTGLFEDLRGAVGMAAEKNVLVATEYHGNTFTDTLETTAQMLEAVPGLRTFWQPPIGLPHGDNLRALERLAERVESLHVFEWSAAGKRRPLSEGTDRWREYLRVAMGFSKTHYATLEFVADDSPDQLRADAKTLDGWLRTLYGGK